MGAFPFVANPVAEMSPSIPPAVPLPAVTRPLRVVCVPSSASASTPFSDPPGRVMRLITPKNALVPYTDELVPADDLHALEQRHVDWRFGPSNAAS